jgi:L-amino acid N-acyltransferase YncA
MNQVLFPASGPGNPGPGLRESACSVSDPAMALHFDIARNPAHFDQILALQQRNLLAAVDPADRATQGFVYARHTRALLEAMAAELPQVVALDAGRVVGYTLAMPASMRDAIPQLVPMFEQFDRARWRGRALSSYRYMVGGQICVDHGYRGRGLLHALYLECRRRLPPDYELCVTEVSEHNAVSLRAHLRMGFEAVASYPDADDRWQILVWDLGQGREAKQ